MASPIDQTNVSKLLLSFPLPDPTSSSPPSPPPSDVLHLTNPTQTPLAFKVKTTNQTRYIVRPNFGPLPPNSTLAINITLNPPYPTTPGPSKDKLLLLLVPVTPPAPAALPLDFWTVHEQHPEVVRVILKVTFESATPPSVDTPHLPDPDPHPIATTPTLNPSPAAAAAPNPTPTGVEPTDLELMGEANYEAALDRARELQRMLEAKNLELARLRMELAETKAESERVLKEAPKPPLGAGGGLGDPVGGVGLLGWAIMGLVVVVLLVNLYKVF